MLQDNKADLRKYLPIVQMFAKDKVGSNELKSMKIMMNSLFERICWSPIGSNLTSTLLSSLSCTKSPRYCYSSTTRLALTFKLIFQDHHCHHCLCRHHCLPLRPIGILDLIDLEAADWWCETSFGSGILRLRTMC